MGELDLLIAVGVPSAEQQPENSASCLQPSGLVLLLLSLVAPCVRLASFRHSARDDEPRRSPLPRRGRRWSADAAATIAVASCSRLLASTVQSLLYPDRSARPAPQAGPGRALRSHVNQGLC